MRILFCCILSVAGLLLAPVSASSAADASVAQAWRRQTVLPDSSPADTLVPDDSIRAIARLLRANGAPGDRAASAAPAIMKYARLHALDPLLVVAIMGVENSMLDRRVRSVDGSIGLMQVQPGWRRTIRDCGEDLRDVEVNVCFGTRILRLALDGSDSIAGALRRYNGCSRGPKCERYVSAVYSRAGRALLLSRRTPE